MSFVPTVSCIPSHIVDVVAAAVFVSVAFLTTSGGIFPLRFGRKTEVVACQLIKAADKLLAVVPADSFYGLLEPLNALWLLSITAFQSDCVTSYFPI